MSKSLKAARFATSETDIVEVLVIPRRWHRESTNERIRQGHDIQDVWNDLVRASIRELSERTGYSVHRVLKHVNHRIKTGKRKKQARVIEPAVRPKEGVTARVPRRPVTPEQNFAGEIPDDGTFAEGAARRVMVNQYERDPKARAACLKKLGYSCEVCGMDFGKRYGEIGEGFIHVHHRKPLALRKAEYKLNPVKDLVPVCPDCHAMLHTSDPPLDTDELREIMRAQAGA